MAHNILENNDEMVLALIDYSFEKEDLGDAEKVEANIDKMIAAYLKKVILNERKANKIYEGLVEDLATKNDELFNKLKELEEKDLNVNGVQEKLD